MCLSENVAVGSGLHQGNGGPVLVPDQEPVVFDVAFPQWGHVAGELVSPVTRVPRVRRRLVSLGLPLRLSSFLPRRAALRRSLLNLVVRMSSRILELRHQCINASDAG